MALSPLSRSTVVTLIALAAMANACSLPPVKPRVARDFIDGSTRVRSVTILPVDLGVQVRGSDGLIRGKSAVHHKLITQINRALAASLARRGYQLAGVIRPDGFVGGPSPTAERMVIHPTDLSALRVEIHQATSYQAPGPGYITASVSADLTRQLRYMTGSDASLYARGWVYVDPSQSAGATAAKIIGFTLLMLVIVGLVVMLFAGGSGKGGKIAGGAARGAGQALKAVGAAMRVAAALGEITIRTAEVAVIAAHQARHVPCHRCPPPPPPPHPPQLPHDQAPPLARPAPPLSRPAPPLPRPAPPVHPQPQALVMHRGAPPAKSTVGLALTMVHNDSGRVLWHANQDYEVEAKSGGDVEELVWHFVKELPLVAP